MKPIQTIGLYSRTAATENENGHVAAGALSTDIILTVSVTKNKTAHNISVVLTVEDAKSLANRLLSEIETANSRKKGET